MPNQNTAWLLFIVSQPGPSGTPRIRLWRLLKSLGAAVLRDGVYLLPRRDDLEAALAEQVGVIREQGGTAYLLNVAELLPDEVQAFCALFDRSADYLPLLEAISRLQAELPKLAEPPARRLLRQRQRELEALRAIDYFPGASLNQVEAALTTVEAVLNRQFSPDEPQAADSAIERRARADFRGRVWATRAHLWIDRVASAWLIRRFVDRDARFLWLVRPEHCPPQALGFDFDGATFTHLGERVTFEVLLDSFDLAGDPALARLGTMVHYLDVGGVPVAEAAGFEAILTGVREASQSDDALLAAMTPVLDALYAAFRQEVT
jgi:hypothetical protein